MAKKLKVSKNIIAEAVQSLVKNEGVLDSLSAGASGIVGGLKNIGQTTVGNYRLGQVDAQMKQFGKKTLKQWDVNKTSAEKAAEKMAQSKNQNVSTTGQTIKQQLSSADDHIKQAVNDLQTAVPKAMMNVPGLDQNAINKNAIQKQFQNPEVQKMLDDEFAKRGSHGQQDGGDFESFVKQHYDGNPKQMTDKQMAAWYRTFLTSKKKQAMPPEEQANTPAPKQLSAPQQKLAVPPPPPPSAVAPKTPMALPAPKNQSPQNALQAMSPEEKEQLKSQSLDLDKPEEEMPLPLSKTKPQKKQLHVATQGSKKMPEKQSSVMPAVDLIKNAPADAQVHLQNYLKSRSPKELEKYLQLIGQDVPKRKEKSSDNVSQTTPVDDTIISRKSLAKKQK